MKVTVIYYGKKAWSISKRDEQDRTVLKNYENTEIARFMTMKSLIPGLDDGEMWNRICDSFQGVQLES